MKTISHSETFSIEFDDLSVDGRCRHIENEIDMKLEEFSDRRFVKNIISVSHSLIQDPYSARIALCSLVIVAEKVENDI